MFTLGNWFLFGLLFLFIILISIGIGVSFENVAAGVISGLVGLILLIVIMNIVRWYNTNTASGIRAVKDYQSELSNGIDREITITAEDGREIFHYEGKVDVESNHTDNYIKFESEEGKRYIIYYGIQDTIKIIEK